MQNRTERPAAILRPDAIILGAAALMTIAMLACGESSKEVTPVEAAPIPTATPVEAREPSPVEIAPSVPRRVTYADAEEAYRGRRYSEAVEMFESYVTEKPGNPFGHYMLGLSAWKSGQPERAESAFVTAIGLDAGFVKSHLNLTRVLLDMGRGDDALERVRIALELDSGNVDGHRLMGRVLTTLRRSGEAIESYRTALSIDSTDSWSMNNMGLILIHMGSFDEALRPLARAVELRPDEPVFQNNLGVALERTGRFGEAIVAYRSAAESDAGHPTAEASLLRVEKLKEKPDVFAVSLEELSLGFAEDVRRWGEERESKREVESTGVIEP